MIMMMIEVIIIIIVDKFFIHAHACLVKNFTCIEKERERESKGGREKGREGGRGRQNACK